MPLLWGCQKTPFIFMVIKTPFLSGLLFRLLLKFSATKLLYPCNGYVTSLEVWHIIETVLLAQVLLTTLKQFLRSECGSSKNTLQMFCLAVIWHGFSFFCTRLHLFTWENRITEVCVFWGFFFCIHQDRMSSSDFQCELVWRMIWAAQYLALLFIVH